MPNIIHCCPWRDVSNAVTLDIVSTFEIRLPSMFACDCGTLVEDVRKLQFLVFTEFMLFGAKLIPRQ